MFKNHRKSLIQYCERSELHLQFAKNGQFDEFLITWIVRSNSITRQVNFYRTKISGQCNVKKRKLLMRHFGWFSNDVPHFKISKWEKNRISSFIKPSTICPNSIWDPNFKRVFGQKILFWHSVCSLLVVKSSYSLTHQLPEYRTEPHRKKCKISYESELQHFKIWPRMTHD